MRRAYYVHIIGEPLRAKIESIRTAYRVAQWMPDGFVVEVVE